MKLHYLPWDLNTTVGEGMGVCNVERISLVLSKIRPTSRSLEACFTSLTRVTPPRIPNDVIASNRVPLCNITLINYQAPAMALLVCSDPTQLQ